MTRIYVRPSEFMGFDINSVESWDYHPETEETKNLSLIMPHLQIVFKSGKERVFRGNQAELVFDLLKDHSISVFIS